MNNPKIIIFNWKEFEIWGIDEENENLSCSTYCFPSSAKRGVITDTRARRGDSFLDANIKGELIKFTLKGPTVAQR